MSHDIISDALNQIMNAKKAGKTELEVNMISKVLINVLDIAKKNNYLDYNLENGKLKIRINDLIECKTIKPRFNVKADELDKYLRRFLPGRNFGIVLISTSKGLMTGKESADKKIGGSLIAYFY